VTEDLVVDASVLVAALAGEAGLGDAARARLAGRRLHLPHLADLEAVSALRDGVRRGSFEAADALTVIEGLQRFPAARSMGPWKRKFWMRLNLPIRARIW
jgi:predicted nucleic acid-binding protein